jgi:hypothetical protein
MTRTCGTRHVYNKHRLQDASFGVLVFFRFISYPPSPLIRADLNRVFLSNLSFACGSRSQKLELLPKQQEAGKGPMKRRSASPSAVNVGFLSGAETQTPHIGILKHISIPFSYRSTRLAIIQVKRLDKRYIPTFLMQMRVCICICIDL